MTSLERHPRAATAEPAEQPELRRAAFERQLRTAMRPSNPCPCANRRPCAGSSGVSQSMQRCAHLDVREDFNCRQAAPTFRRGGGNESRSGRGGRWAPRCAERSSGRFVNPDSRVRGHQAVSGDPDVQRVEEPLRTRWLPLLGEGRQSLAVVLRDLTPNASRPTGRGVRRRWRRRG